MVFIISIDLAVIARGDAGGQFASMPGTHAASTLQLWASKLPQNDPNRIGLTRSVSSFVERAGSSVLHREVPTTEIAQAMRKVSGILQSPELAKKSELTWTGVKKSNFEDEWLRSLLTLHSRPCFLSEYSSNLGVLVQLQPGDIDTESEPTLLRGLDRLSKLLLREVDRYMPYRMTATFTELGDGKRLWVGYYAPTDDTPWKRNVAQGVGHDHLRSVFFCTDGRYLIYRFSYSASGSEPSGVIRHKKPVNPTKSRFDPPGLSPGR